MAGLGHKVSRSGPRAAFRVDLTFLSLGEVGGVAHKDLLVQLVMDPLPDLALILILFVAAICTKNLFCFILLGLDVLIPSVGKLWKNIVDIILSSVPIGLSVLLEALNDLVLDPVLPGDILVAIGPVSVAVVHDFVMNRRFLIETSV